MRQFYLQKAFYQLAKHPPVQLTAVARHRLQLLSAWEALCARAVPASQAAVAVGLPRATLYRWRARYRQLGPKGLELRSRRPKRVRRRNWDPEAVQAVLELRELYPRWGKEKLALLAAQEGWRLSASSVGRMLKDLLRRGLLPPAGPKRHLLRRPAAKRPYAVRKPKEYAVISPGDLVQVDTLGCARSALPRLRRTRPAVPGDGPAAHALPRASYSGGWRQRVQEAVRRGLPRAGSTPVHPASPLPQTQRPR